MTSLPPTTYCAAHATKDSDKSNDNYSFECKHVILRQPRVGTCSVCGAGNTESLSQETSPRVTVITLRAPQTSATKRVAWTEDTVDNEEMNKKKSKCCCIYEKPRKFDESSSSDSDDECEHCFGHVERRKKRHQGADAATTSAGGTQTQVETEEVPQPEPTTTVTLQAPPQHSVPEPHSVT